MLRPLTYLAASGLVLVAVATTMGVALAGLLLRGEPLDAWSLGLAHAIGFATAIVVGLQGAGEVSAREVIGARRFRPTLLLGLVPLALGASVLFAELDNWVQEGVPATQEEIVSLAQELSRGGLPGGAIVHLLLVAPILEEGLFRGVLQRRLGVQYGRRQALLFTAGAFALAHLGTTTPRYLPELVLAGLALGFVADRAGSAVASAIVHAIFNSAPFVISERVLRLPGWNAVDRALRGRPDHVPVAFVLAAFVLFLVGVAAVLKARRPRPA
jgi:hypothetical protein